MFGLSLIPKIKWLIPTLNQGSGTSIPTKKLKVIGQWNWPKSLEKWNNRPFLNSFPLGNFKPTCLVGPSNFVWGFLKESNL